MQFFSGKSQIFAVGLVALALFTTNVRAQESNARLEELRPQLQEALQIVAPDVRWKLKGNELTASYKTRAIKIFSVAPDDDRNLQFRQEIEPDEGGFVLRVFSDLPSFAVQPPREERQQRWNMFLSRTNLRAGNATVFAMSNPEVETQIYRV